MIQIEVFDALTHGKAMLEKCSGILEDVMCGDDSRVTMKLIDEILESVRHIEGVIDDYE